MTRRDAVEKCISKFCQPPKWEPIDEESQLDILIIRNNDIGDLILTTPLFQALKELYPHSRLHVGIGDWNKGLLDHNPYVDQVIPLNAPWHNKFSCKHSPNSPIGFLKSMFYIISSPEVRAIRSSKYGLGIDVLGSQESTVLMHWCTIPRRMGAKGYAGGYSGCQSFREFKVDQSVPVSILDYAKMLGMHSKALPSPKPQIYLTQQERQQGLLHWAFQKKKKRIVVSTGAGFSEKCWPTGNLGEVLEVLSSDPAHQILFIGGQSDRENGNKMVSSNPGLVNLAGKTTLRETFAIISHADLVICNSTMFMHVAAAFDIPNVVVLGEWYDSAILHSQQWGHKHTFVLGREDKCGITTLSTPKEVIQLSLEILN